MKCLVWKDKTAGMPGGSLFLKAAATNSFLQRLMAIYSICYDFLNKAIFYQRWLDDRIRILKLF